MVIRKQFGLLAILSLCLAVNSQHQKARGVFRCRDEVIPRSEAEDAAKYGCEKMRYIHTSSQLAASFTDSDNFGVKDAVYFTWPVYEKNNYVEKADLGYNRVVIDFSCQLVGLIRVTSDGHERCQHLIDNQDSPNDYLQQMYQVAWATLPHFGFKFKNEIYVKSQMQNFVNSKNYIERKCSPLKVISATFPTFPILIKDVICAYPIFLDKGEIRNARSISARLVLMGHKKNVLGIIGRIRGNWKIFAEVRSLDAVNKASRLSMGQRGRAYDELNSIDHEGIQISASSLKSHLKMACIALEKKKQHPNHDIVYPERLEGDNTKCRVIWAWPLRQPEASRNGGNDYILFDEYCNFVSVTRRSNVTFIPVATTSKNFVGTECNYLSLTQQESKRTVNLLASFDDRDKLENQIIPPSQRQKKIDPETRI